MSLNAIQATIKKLPPLPMVAHKLIMIMKQDSCSAEDVTKVLSTDQALAGKVLKLANSSFYGLSGQVGSVSRAVVILGFSAIRSMALGLGMAQTIKKATGDLDIDYFWRHALFVAAAARTLAVDNGKVDPEEIFIAGLMHDLGRLVLEMADPELEAKLADVPASRLLDAETESAGMSHTKTGQQVMRHWNLPEALVRMARFHHHPTNFNNDDLSLSAFVQLGDLMARTLGQSREPAANDPDPVELAKSLDVSLRESEDLLARACQEVSRTRAFLDISGIDLEFENPLAHLETNNGEPENTGTAVYLGTDPDRGGWVHGQLGIHAWETVAMKAFISGEGGEVDLAIIDPRSVSSKQAGKLGKLLSSRGVRVAVLGNADALAAVLPEAVEIPMAFSREDLLRLCEKVAS